MIERMKCVSVQPYVRTIVTHIKDFILDNFKIFKL